MQEILPLSYALGFNELKDFGLDKGYRSLPFFLNGMQEKYYKAEHPTKAYPDIGYPHPSKPWDLEHGEKCRMYPKVAGKVITNNCKRVQVGQEEEGGKPKIYAVWNELETRTNDSGNKETAVHTQLGIYSTWESVYRWQWAVCDPLFLSHILSIRR